MFRNFVGGLYLTSNAMTRNILREKSEALTDRLVGLCRELQDAYSNPVVLERILKTCGDLKHIVAAAEQVETDAAYIEQMPIIRKMLVSIGHYLQFLKAINYISPKVYYRFYDEIEEVIMLTETVSKPSEFKTEKGLIQWEEIHLEL